MPHHDDLPWLRGWRRRLEQRLQALFSSPRGPWSRAPSRLKEACAYALLGGGKRLRPHLLLTAYAVHRARLAAQNDNPLSVVGHSAMNDAQGERGGGPLQGAPGGMAATAWDAAVALEMVHAYSLVHDDLPAMDNDNLRRGRPTVHRAFDEATAILVGDALLTEAFGVLSRNPDALSARLVGLLARAAGPEGMVGGQVLDMALTGGGDRITGCPRHGQNGPSAPLQSVLPRDLDTLRRMHQGKTGALFRFAAVAGVLCAEPTASRRSRAWAVAERFGVAVGLLYQITDDIRDATTDAATLGKTPGKDARDGKLSYVELLGLDGARQAQRAAFRDTLAALDIWGHAAEPLRDWVRQLVSLSDFSMKG